MSDEARLPTVAECTRCHGVRFIFLTESTIDKLCPPYAPQLAPLGVRPEKWEEGELKREAMIVSRRGSMRWTGYPCPMCCPEAFALWDGGHYAPNHSCPTCRPDRRRSAPRKSEVPVLTPASVGRRDLD